MRKKLTLGLLMVMFAGLSVAAPLQNFEYGGVADEAFDGFDIEVTGGETSSGTVTFDNRLNRDLPLMFEITVSSDMVMVGPEFDIDASLTESGGMLDCNTVKVSGDTVDYRCFEDSEAEIEPGSNTIYFDSTANTRIAPGNYEVEISVKSSVGEGEVVGTKNVSSNDTVEVDAGTSSVEVNSSGDANVTVKKLDRVSTSPPAQESDFVGGVSVDVSNSSGDVKATGTVSFTYSDEALDERDVNVYFYDDSRPPGQRWVNEGGTQYTSNNTVVAEVSHFSTYGAFAEPEPEPEPVVFDPGFDLPQEDQENQSQPGEDENVTDDEDTGQTPVGDDSSEDDTQNDGGDEEDQVQDGDGTGPEQEPSTPSGTGSATGLFTAEPGSFVIGILALLITAAAVLQYTGRYNFLESLKAFRG